MKNSAFGARSGALLESDADGGTGTEPSATPLSTVIGFRLRRAHRRMAAHGGRWLAEAGLPLSPMQGGLLLLVEGNPGLRQNELARLLNIEAPTLSQALTPLLEAGYLTRRRAEGDGRALLLFLTAEGERAAELVRTEMPEQEASALAPLTMAERAELRRLLDKVLMHEPLDRAEALQSEDCAPPRHQQGTNRR